MHLVAEAAPRVGIVGELCGKHHLADLFVVAIGFLIIPKVDEVLAERMSGDDLLAILDDVVEVCALVGCVPFVVELAGPEEVCFGQEVGCGALGDASGLCGLVGQQVVGLLEVSDDLLVAVFERVAGEVGLYPCGGGELQGHTAKLLDQLEVGVGAQEVSFSQARVVVLAVLVIVQWDVVD